MKSVIRANMYIKELMMQTHCIVDVERGAGMKNTDLISRKAAIDALAKFVPYSICDESEKSYMNGLTDAYNLICQLPSVEPWDIVKRMLNELEQKEERLYSDYCDATARLNAINKIAESDQKPNQKIDGIKPLAEMEVTE